MNDQINIIKNWLGSGSVNLFGPPFSGKDTQAKKLADIFGGEVVAGGDILRHSSNNPEIKSIMAAGGIIPSELFLTIIPPFFSRPELSQKPLFLSSVGRLMPEASRVMQAARDSGHPIKAVVLLDLPESGVWRHFEIANNLHDRGERADDKAETLTARLKEFERTSTVINHYRELGLLLEVDDTQDVDQVTQAILDALEKLASTST